MAEIEGRVELRHYLRLDRSERVPVLMGSDRDPEVVGYPLRNLSVAGGVESSARCGPEPEPPQEQGRDSEAERRGASVAANVLAADPALQCC